MEVQSLFLNITSDNPSRLYAFYKDTVGLPVMPDMGEFALNIAGATLGIDGHSETKGAAKDPTRVLIDLFVADLTAEQSRLESLGVKFSRTAGKEPWGGVISTFPDPDGNLVQIIEFRPPTA
jgi:predicted enzyme related to lactoylglutathione lyase